MHQIFLTSTMHRPFIMKDVALLRQHFTVDFFVGCGIIAACRIFLHAARADLSICWFASVYSWPLTLGAKLFGKPSVIIVGGVDAAAMPELGYGLWLNKWKGKLVRQALRRADRILVVDNRLKENLEKHSGLRLDHAIVLPTGYDPTFWTPPEHEGKRSGLLCVATCDSTQRARVKGIDTFLEMAAALPHIQCTLVGVEPSFARAFPFDVPANVTLLPPLDREELRRLYQQADIYCQPSRHEGLSNVLCEAMLCGLVPVATDVGGAATAIGESGTLVPPGKPDLLATAVKHNLSPSPQQREEARRRISQLFPEYRREEHLVALVNTLTGGVEGES